MNGNVAPLVVIRAPNRSPGCCGTFGCSTWDRPLTVECVNTPGMRDGLAGFEDQQVVAGHEGIRRAGHGLNDERLRRRSGASGVAGENPAASGSPGPPTLGQKRMSGLTRLRTGTTSRCRLLLIRATVE